MGVWQLYLRYAETSRMHGQQPKPFPEWERDYYSAWRQ